MWWWTTPAAWPTWTAGSTRCGNNSQATVRTRKGDPRAVNDESGTGCTRICPGPARGDSCRPATDGAPCAGPDVRCREDGVVCPRCSSDVPEVSHFCHHCGNDMRTGDAERKKAYAARPDEPVASFRLVSTIMPQGSGQQPYTYKVALGIALLLTVVTAALGALPVAIMIAAFAIPIVYIIYLYDVNLWEDEPIPVVAAAFVLTGVLAAVFTWLWKDKLALSLDTIGGNSAGPSGRDLLILLLLVPVVSELIRQIGPLYL